MNETNEQLFCTSFDLDVNGETDVFTHMMPFLSYAIPYSCGPDPNVCCQFDFKCDTNPSCSPMSLWKLFTRSNDPIAIIDSNIREKSELLVDQWKKKASLYRTNTVLVPLGDDFRYMDQDEWEAKVTNFNKLFDFINNEPSFNVQAKFGTLQEYFDDVHAEKRIDDFPTLSGDFFTYADNNDNYWSGYYTSRPFHKHLDRILLSYLRFV